MNDMQRKHSFEDVALIDQFHMEGYVVHLMHIECVVYTGCTRNNC